MKLSDLLFERTFMGSPCTKDCSGHRAGYAWSRVRGGQRANSWSPSFNNGAALAMKPRKKITRMVNKKLRSSAVRTGVKTPIKPKKSI